MCNAKRSRGAIGMIIFALISCSAERSWDNPNEILAAIAKDGSAQTIARMTAGDRLAWEAVLRHIEKGETQWLEVARALRSGSDAVTTIELRFAVARALPKAPREVLALIGNGFQLEEICIIPFIETDSTTELVYLQTTEKALLGLGFEVYNQNYERCLEFFETQIKSYVK